MNAPAHSVVVAVGVDGFDSAVTFAVAEARRTGRPLHLVHVLHLPPGDAYVGVYGGMLDLANQALADAEAFARTLDADLVITTELVDHGMSPGDLVAGVDQAAMLVLQHRALSRLKRVFTGSVVHSVAGRSGVPVISVPEGWSPSPDRNLVTAAVQDPVEAPALLRQAFVEAEVRGARLRVLHAWWLASGYDVVVVDGQMRQDWTSRSEDEMAPVIAPLRQEFPTVTVDVVVRHAPPVEAVLDAAEDSELLVIGRRHHLLPLGSHLGPVARGALDHGACPVLVMPELPDPVRVTDPARSGVATQLASSPG